MKLRELLKWARQMFTRRIWLKLTSLILALLLWAYIISSNPNLTRSQTIADVSVNMGATSALTGRSLALATDIFTAYQGALTATVTVPQNSVGELDASMIRVSPDYTGIYKPGTYNVPLIASFSGGSVTDLSPDSITVVVDDMDTRILPVEIALENRRLDDYWYSFDAYSVNPQTVTISGPASLIQSVTGANVTIDVSERTAGFTRSHMISFNTANGEPLTSKLLTKTSSTCYVKVDIYPKKSLPVVVDETHFKLAPGYEIKEIKCTPASITVAADQELLDSLEYLPLELSDEPGESSSTFTSRFNVSGIEDFKYISSKQVYVTVTISKIEE